MGKLVCGYIGNFRPPASTENHIRETLESEPFNFKIIQLQEDVVSLPDVLQCSRGIDLLLWTRTGAWLKCNGFEMLSRVRVPTIGIHLDLFWGLEREHEVETNAFFKCKMVFTADGGHQEQFKAAGVNHFGLNPGVLKRECYIAEPRDDLRCDVGFIGSRGYHSEHWRGALITFLEQTYGQRFRLFGASGDSWRGDDLNRLYSSVKCAVGDSCFADRCKKYVSDRFFESCGRAAATVFPRIEGIDNCYTDGVHLRYYQAGNFADLKSKIDEMVAMSDEQRMAMRRAAVEHTKANHTYHNRMTELLHVKVPNSAVHPIP